LNKVDGREKCTVLHRAVRNGDKYHGANRNSIKPKSKTKMFPLETNLNSLLLKIRSNVGPSVLDGNTALHSFTENGFRRFAKLMLEMKADVNIQNNSNRTPLHLAFFYS